MKVKVGDRLNLVLELPHKTGRMEGRVALVKPSGQFLVRYPCPFGGMTVVTAVFDRNGRNKLLLGASIEGPVTP